MIYGACPIFIQHIQQMQRSAEHTERYLERVIYMCIYIYTPMHMYIGPVTSVTRSRWNMIQHRACVLSHGTSFKVHGMCAL